MVKWSDYLNKEIWNVRASGSTKFRALWVRSLRIFMIVFHGFRTRQIQQGAASLTYYSLIAIVPVVAVLFAIAKGLQIQKPIVAWLESHFGGNTVGVNHLIEFANKTVSQANQQMFAFIALLLALWAGIKMLMYIEVAMNQIWDIQRGRTLSQRFSDYLAMLFFCPLVIIMSSFVSIVASAAIADLTKNPELLKIIDPIKFIVISSLPFILNWLLLTVIYMFMPNTQVGIVPAIFGALVTSIFYLVIQLFYFYLQAGVTQYNAIYGTFAALPLFLIWMHLSWIIVLIGAKLTYAFQNLGAYDITDYNDTISRRCLMVLSIRIAHLCVRDFCKLRLPTTAKEISRELQISLPLTRQILGRLVEAKVLISVLVEKWDDEGYQPAMPPEQMTIKQVINMLDNQGLSINIPTDKDLNVILSFLKDCENKMEKSESNLLLKDF